MDTTGREANQAALRNAEEMAARFAEGSFEHESWTRIAEGYKHLVMNRQPDTLNNANGPLVSS
jgi:outer membrane protein assembly factor BamD (BamD/ComL family)